jgi:hypothetical protein
MSHRGRTRIQSCFCLAVYVNYSYPRRGPGYCSPLTSESVRPPCLKLSTVLRNRNTRGPRRTRSPPPGPFKFLSRLAVLACWAAEGAARKNFALTRMSNPLKETAGEQGVTTIAQSSLRNLAFAMCLGLQHEQGVQRHVATAKALVIAPGAASCDKTNPFGCCWF